MASMSPRSRLLIALTSTGLLAYIAVGFFFGRVMGDTTYGQLAVFNEVVRMVLDSYVEPINLDRAMAAADRGLTEALDGDSAYLDEAEFKAYQQGSRDSEAEIGLAVTRRYGFLMALQPRAGSPADKAGIRAGDILKTIDGRHTRPLGAPAGERLLRGAPGSTVKLQILRSGSDPLDIPVVRERLTPTPLSIQMMADEVGYVKVPELSPKAVDELRGAVEGLTRNGARRLILDVRGAAFGQASEAARAAELFMKGGMVAKLVGRHRADQVLSADAGRSISDLPLAVLVDRGTAGAAEITAAALLDSGRATLVGERTFGRAAVQKPIPLATGGLVLTVARYVSPKGNVIHGKGVAPTVAVDVPDEPPAVGIDPGDPILDRALEVLKGEAAAKKAA
jgi:carboxyl-terminal processing protease